MSTSLFHPQAEQPIISAVVTLRQRPAIGIEVVGDNSVLILTSYDTQLSLMTKSSFTRNLKMVSDSQPASVPLYLSFVRASPPRSTRMLASSFSLQTFFYSRMRMLSDWNTGRFLQITSPRPSFALSRPRFKGGGIYYAAQTPIRHRFSVIARNHFMPIHIMPDLSFAPENAFLILLKISHNDVAKLHAVEKSEDERERRDCYTRSYDERPWRETFDDPDSDDSDGMDDLSKPIGQVRINRRTQNFWERNQCF